MNYNQIEEITATVVKELKEYYGESSEVISGTFNKNNGIKLHGVTIKGKGQMVAPTFYIESFLEEYSKESIVSSIACRIIELKNKYDVNKEIDMSFFESYEQVKDRLGIRLVNWSMNEEYLKELPHVQYLDFAIIFSVQVEDDQIGEGEIIVRNEHIKLWGVSINDLYSDAKRKMSWRNPYILRSIQDIIKENTDVDMDMENEEAVDSIYVLTNEKKYYGSSAILYDGVLDEVYEKVGGDFYILPSSIHEVIILPISEKIQAEEQLSNMVKEINESQLERQDVLSNNIYIYRNCELRAV